MTVVFLSGTLLGMGQPSTIFDRLREKRTDGQTLGELIAEACDVGDDLVEALIDLLDLPESLSRQTAARAAVSRAYAEPKTNGNGSSKAA